MAGRRAAYRKRHQNKMSMILVMMVVVMILIVVYVKSIELKAKNAEYQAKITQLESEIQQEEQRKEELIEQGKYMQTKKFVEEIAKQKLGLVYENEILFQEE